MTVNRPALACLCALFLAPIAWGREEGRNAYDEFLRSQIAGSTVEPAAGALDSWFRSNRIPLWRADEGGGTAWEEIGPSVLRNGWGGMDNAGRMCSFVVDPRNSRVAYAAAASGGLWKTEDGCRTWTPIADHLPSLAYGALALDPFNPDVIYAGSGEMHYSLDSFAGVGLFRSRDGGRNWDLLGIDVFNNRRFSRIAHHPRRAGFLYAATSAGVFRTTDSGATWARLLQGEISDFELNPANPNQLIAAVGAPWGTRINGLYRSTDGGETWLKATDGPPVDGSSLGRIQTDHCRRYPEVVYASVYGTNSAPEGLYRSNDFGASWVKLPMPPNYAGGQSWYDNYLAVSPTNPNLVFLGGLTTYRSTDGGMTWVDNTRSYAGGPIHPDHHYMTFDPNAPSTAYLCTDGGVFRTLDDGDTWESVNEGLATIQFQYVDVHPWDRNIAYGGTQDNGTNKYTGRLDWDHVFTGDGGTTRVNWNNPDIVYTEYVNLTICKSTDAGRTWAWNVTSGIDRSGALFYAPYTLDPSDPDTLVAGSRRVYRSTNAAESWTEISPILGSAVSAVTVAPNNREVIYAGTSDGRAWVTPNLGTDWYEITTGLPRAFVADICVDPRNARHVYLAQVAWGGNRIWRSDDAGGTWKPIGEGLNGAPVRMVVVHPLRPDTIMIATEVGCFISPDRGEKWFRLGRGLANAPVFTIVANARTGYVTVGTHGRGAWRLPLP